MRPSTLSRRFKARSYERNFNAQSAALGEEMNERKRPLLNDLLDLTVCVAYVENLLANSRVSRYLKETHPAVLDRLERFCAEVANPMPNPQEETVTVWSISRAKDELAELIRECEKQGPQLVRVRNDPAVIVISIRRWRAALRRYPGLEEFVFLRKKLPHIPKMSQTTRVGRTNPIS